MNKDQIAPKVRQCKKKKNTSTFLITSHSAQCRLFAAASAGRPNARSLLQNELVLLSVMHLNQSPYWLAASQHYWIYSGKEDYCCSVAISPASSLWPFNLLTLTITAPAYQQHMCILWTQTCFVRKDRYACLLICCTIYNTTFTLHFQFRIMRGQREVCVFWQWMHT